MKRNLFRKSVILILVLAISTLFAGEYKKIHKTFDHKKSLIIEGVHGDWDIMSSSKNEIVIDIKYSSSLEGVFVPKFKERGNKLEIEEDFIGRIRFGSIHWTLTVPNNIDISYSTSSGDFSFIGEAKGIDVSSASGDIEIDGCSGDVNISVASGDVSGKNIRGDISISAASGDIELEDIKGDMDVSTASGDIDLKNCKGKFESSTASGDISAKFLKGDCDFGTASGDIELQDVKGAMDVNCASGDIDADKVTILGDSDFSTASGDIEISLKESFKFDLNMSAASGNILLDLNGHKANGYFELTARKKMGKLSSDIPFDKVEVFKRRGKEFERGTFSLGSKSTEIFMESHSGKVELRK